MSNYNSLKTIIDANIKQNGNQEITGQILNSVLNHMVNILGTGYQYAGVATPAIDPGTPDAKVFYIANGKGIYTNFGGLEVTEDEVVILYYDTTWHKVATGIASIDKLADLEEKVNGKQDALTLTVKGNGNIVISNIQGQSKEFMPATPSGDPMHYAYVAAGAEYNDTGADIVKTAPWADMLDDNPEDDGTKYGYEYSKVLHKAGHWYLNGVGDLTNDEIRMIYMLKYNNPYKRLQGANIRTDLPVDINYYYYIGDDVNISFFGRNSTKLEVIKLSNATYLRYDLAIGPFSYCEALKHVITELNASRQGMNIDAPNLITLKVIYAAYSISISGTQNLSVKSVLYMINNEAATSPITITLHKTVYDRCMANDAITTALQNHTNVSLASA